MVYRHCQKTLVFKKYQNVEFRRLVFTFSSILVAFCFIPSYRMIIFNLCWFFRHPFRLFGPLSWPHQTLCSLPPSVPSVSPPGPWWKKKLWQNGCLPCKHEGALLLEDCISQNAVHLKVHVEQCILGPPSCKSSPGFVTFVPSRQENKKTPKVVQVFRNQD